MKIFFLMITLMMQLQAAQAQNLYKKESFEAAQKRNEKIVLDFYADWCPTCLAQAQSLNSLAQKGLLKGITVFSVNYDEEKELKKSLNVNAQSTLVSFYGNVETGRSTGITDESEIKNFLNKTLKSLTLRDQLELMKVASQNKIPTEAKKVMEEALTKLKQSKIEEKVIKVGAKFPDFILPNAHGKKS